MSLINEALKRTRDNLPAPPPTGTLPYQTPPRVPPPAHAGRQKPLIIALALVVALLVAGSLITLHVARTMLTGSPPANPIPATEPLPATAAAAEQLPAAEPTPATVEAPPPASVETPATAAPPEPPKLVLQGITLDPNVREALINGEVVRVGDSVAGATVVGIEPRRVTIRWRDTELVLRMP